LTKEDCEKVYIEVETSIVAKSEQFFLPYMPPKIPAVIGLIALC